MGVCLGGSVTIQMWNIVWDCLWFSQLKDPLGPIKKSRALCPGSRFLPQSNIAINVCERAVKHDSINEFYVIKVSLILRNFVEITRATIATNDS